MLHIVKTDIDKMIVNVNNKIKNNTNNIKIFYFVNIMNCWVSICSANTHRVIHKNEMRIILVSKNLAKK